MVRQTGTLVSLEIDCSLGLQAYITTPSSDLGAGDHTQVLMLMWQALYWQIPLPSACLSLLTLEASVLHLISIACYKSSTGRPFISYH